MSKRLGSDSVHSSCGPPEHEGPSTCPHPYRAASGFAWNRPNCQLAAQSQPSGTFSFRVISASFSEYWIFFSHYIQNFKWIHDVVVYYICLMLKLWFSSVSALGLCWHSIGLSTCRECLLSIEALYKICCTTGLRATFACAVVGMSVSCWEEWSYNLQRAEVVLSVKQCKVFTAPTVCTSHALSFGLWFVFVFFKFFIFFLTILPFLVNSIAAPFPVPAHLSVNQHLTNAIGILEDCT